MSDTIKHKYTNHKKHRENTYGLCMCVQCKYGRSRNKKRGMVNIMKKKWRHAWKQNKEFIKGLYTD